MILLAGELEFLRTLRAAGGSVDLQQWATPEWLEVLLPLIKAKLIYAAADAIELTETGAFAVDNAKPHLSGKVWLVAYPGMPYL